MNVASTTYLQCVLKCFKHYERGVYNIFTMCSKCFKHYERSVYNIFTMCSKVFQALWTRRWQQLFARWPRYSRYRLTTHVLWVQEALLSQVRSSKSAFALVLLALQDSYIAPDVTSISHHQYTCRSTYSHTSLYQFWNAYTINQSQITAYSIYRI